MGPKQRTPSSWLSFLNSKEKNHICCEKLTLRIHPKKLTLRVYFEKSSRQENEKEEECGGKE
jgi:hypothetical protein